MFYNDFVQIVCYYLSERMAMNLACRKLHIPVMDLQHGVKGDLHVTHSSSTVIESKQFGIPSVIFNTFGEEMFPDLVLSGWVLVVLQKTTILDSDRTLQTQYKLKHSATNRPHQQFS